MNGVKTIFGKTSRIEPNLMCEDCLLNCCWLDFHTSQQLPLIYAAVSASSLSSSLEIRLVVDPNKLLKVSLNFGSILK